MAARQNTRLTSTKRKRVSTQSDDKSRRISIQNPTTDSIRKGWSDLLPEHLESILKKLPFVDIIRLKSVCFSWFSSVQSYLASPSKIPVPQSSWVIIPDDKKQEDHDTTDSVIHKCCFFNFSENRVYRINNGYNKIDDPLCVGSSHGWLIIWDAFLNLYLTNPFSGATIELPNLIDLHGRDRPRFVDSLLRRTFITKAILLCDPSHGADFVVVVICGYSSRLEFCKKGEKSWGSLFSTAHKPYCDIICYKGLLLALTDNASVEVWSFQSPFPTLVMKVEPVFPRELEILERFPREKFSCRSYLVESMGELLCVKRLFGNFVDQDGNVIIEADLMSDEDVHPLICPYRTKDFFVYKLDHYQEKWIPVDSIGNRALFLGGNHSTSVSSQDIPECKGNSIYFTDDNWDQVDEDYLYGGHDFGVYNLEDRTVKPYYLHGSEKVDPPHVFIFPNPW